METDVPKYEYAPLDGPHDIRVLELRRGAYDKETMIFNCKLRVINLEDSKHPPYLALSYTWKLPDIEEEQAPLRPSLMHIRCDGGVIDIGENLYDCLYQLEHMPGDEDEEPAKEAEVPDITYFWIDAICINQNDLGERASQVAMMQKIYSKASETVIWLGRQDKYSRQAVPLFDQLSKAADLHFAHVEEVTGDLVVNGDIMVLIGDLHDQEYFRSVGITPPTPLDWKSISSFFTRSWFHRLWTVQELVVGKSYDKMMLCGGALLSLEKVDKFMALASVKGWIHALKILEFGRSQHLNTDAVLGIEISLGIRAIYRTTPECITSGLLQHHFGCHDEESFLAAKFAWMLHMCRQKQVTDERDRVFASSGMISSFQKPGSWHLLGPDYSKSTEEVFTNASRFILQSLRNLSWLSFVEDRSLKVHENLPSWVPDLAGMGRPASLSLAGNHNVFRNRGDLMGGRQPGEPLILIPDNTSLYVKGSLLDKLAGTTYDMDKTSMEHKFSKVIIAAAKFSFYEPGDTWLHALMKTFAVDTAEALDWNSSFATTIPSRDFSDLLAPFIHFLKFEIILEMWDWYSSRAEGVSDWWKVNADFARLCDLDESLPPREEFDECFYSWANKDKKFLEMVYNPAQPYMQRTTSCTCRAFAQTQNFRMGLVPLSAKSEDEVWIIEGARVPFILRRRLDESYELMGEAYIHGIMQGELFEQGKELNFDKIRLE